MHKDKNLHKKFNKNQFKYIYIYYRKNNKIQQQHSTILAELPKSKNNTYHSKKEDTLQFFKLEKLA